MLRTVRGTKRTRGRRGVTLVELLVTLILLGLIGAAVTTVVSRQQRFYILTNETRETRAQVRQATNVLPADLRWISTAGADIYAMTDSSLDVRSNTGSAVVCNVVGGKTPYVVYPPLKLGRKVTLTTWMTKPRVGDSVYMYDGGALPATTDDVWRAHQITGWTEVVGNVATGCQPVSGYTLATDLVAGNPSYQVTVLPAPTKTLVKGTIARFFRRVHYSLFLHTDGKWYLGYYDCVQGRVPVCNPIQPVSGPYRAYASAGSGASGLTFTYFDSTGAVTATPNQVARINVVVRAEGESSLKVPGGPTGPFRDSLRFDVAVRNRT